MKKLLVIIISVILLMVLSACGETSNNTHNTSNNETSSENGTPSTSTSSKELIYDSTEAFDYSDVDGGIIITYFKNYDYVEYDKIYIPEKIDGKSVVGIGAFDSSETYYGNVFAAIFGNCEVVVPDSVKYIGGESFIGAKGLVKLSGGKNCKTIGEFAFMNCENLKEITFIDNVTDLAGNAFAGCTAWEANH